MMILHLISLFVINFPAVLAASPPITIYAWPLSAPSPKPFAEIVLPSATDGTAEVRTKNIPNVSDGEIVRLGILDDKKAWSGIATSADSFRPGIAQRLSLHTNTEGQVVHIGFSSFKAVPQNKGIQGDDIFVEIVPIQMGVQPVLNKPVILNAEGKVDKPGQEDNRTFLQKYWWAILLFLVLQLAAGGGKE
ncbi:uncharacterized protein PV09_00957 [Verruconis gallopava]|uniref:ER membrane protein complex subunit 10 n=1 Tax=Verruconis gallopava TaxID=253628 RepID=A0A0D1XZ24_9PEZI|nr:uncharacterized protein PV09_00957 [Verruconis gallopava]KIW08011.1 hypothetical protein PV09_00957 [Verruconis gallopava]